MLAHCYSAPSLRYNHALTAIGRLASADEPCPNWHVLWTRNNCEQLVYQQLLGKGFDAFLPQVDRWRSRGGFRYLSRTPMFPGYVFLHHAVDKWSYLEVCKTRGIVKLLGERWDRLATIPDREIDAIRRAQASGLPRMQHPYLHDGKRVRVTRGPLANVEGILVERGAEHAWLVLSVELLRQSLAVKIGCDAVIPA
ncbi:MAG: transcription termination/antitermination NusG family protein [Gammaproteobacteria bacterium]